MVLLAPKLPYTHPFAGGYPRRGGQPLPTDPEAIDYLERVAAADGAAVEVGVAVAVDAFIKGCKADGIWDAIKASCLLCGPRTFNGATTALVGDDPTPYNWSNFDYNRVTGLKGDGATTYLDSGRAGNADGLDDRHFAIYKTSTTVATEWQGGMYDTTAPNHNTGIRGIADATERLYASSLGSEAVTVASPSSSTAGLRGIARTSPTNVNYFTPTDSGSSSIDSTREEERNYFMFALNLDGSAYQPSASRLAFYSIGSALDLSIMDTHVSRYVAAVQFWHNTGLAATGYDDATIDYVNRAYSNGGTL